jgi:hypothetical protein
MGHVQAPLRLGTCPAARSNPLRLSPCACPLDKQDGICVLLVRSLFCQRNNGWFLHTPGSVSWSGSQAQFARDLSVGVPTPILLFFLLGGVALHERLVG